MSNRAYKIALVAGEASSDMIGADLIKDLFALSPGVEIIAVGGAKIKQTQATVILDNEAFSVMGLVEVLKDLPQLLKLKKSIVKRILAFKPDVFIGVDSPDLNFSVAKNMKKANIPVVHYVSPSVWAWRPKRIYKMASFIDCLLTLFPFEVSIYKKTSIKAEFVGHPLAKKIPVVIDKALAKKQIGVNDNKKILALLPGSRDREIKSLMPIFADTVKQLHLSNQWQIMSSNVSENKKALVDLIAAEHQLKINWVDSASDLLQAADFALLGSGTVALEALLCKTPMVVAYQISQITWLIVKTFKLMQLPYYSLPNVLYQGFLVPEVMQKDLNVVNLVNTCQKMLTDDDCSRLIKAFTEIHLSLLTGNSNQAALSVLKFLDAKQ